MHYVLTKLEKYRINSACWSMARQVGKGFIIELFARENYKHYISINFDKKPAYQAIFDGDLDAETIIKQITLRVPGSR